MPSSSSASPSSTPLPLKPQSSGTSELKPIGICLSNSTPLEMSNSSTTLASSRPSTSISNANTNYYHGTSASSSAPTIPVGALSVMVARFATTGVDANTQQQTVIFHPRPGAAISSASRANVVMSTGGNAIRTSAMIGTAQSVPSSSAPVSVSSSTPSISVRTTQLIGQQTHHQPLSVMNLSGVNSNATGVGQNKITRPFSMTSANALPIESVSLVVANDNTNTVVNARPIRLHTTDGKQNATVHSINKITPAQRTHMMTSAMPSIVTAQSPKMISIGHTGTASGAAISQRVGFIGQIPGTTVTSGGNKPILNLTPLPANAIPGLHRSFVINSSTNINSGANATVHNMVTVSGAVASFATAVQAQSGKMSINVTNNSTALRQGVVTSFVQHGSGTVSQHSQNVRSVPQIAAATTANTMSSSSSQSQSVLQPINTCATSPLRPTILSSPVTPIKQQQLQSSTPSSPRPSILIRKRIANDTQCANATTALFKTSSTTSPSAAPLRGTIIAINSSDSSSISLTTNQEHRNDVNTIMDNIQSIAVRAAPLTPNSEGNTTPRKKPRKQLLEPFNMKSSQNVQLLNDSGKIKDELCNDKDEFVAIANKKPRVSLLRAYSMQSKSLQFHFLRYSDVRPKPEKKLTLSELSNEGIQKKNGWKIHHLATQMEVMSDNEISVYDRLSHFLETFEKDAPSSSPTPPSLQPITALTTVLPLTSGASECKTQQSISNNNISFGDSFDSNMIATKLNDLIRGNLQRSNLFSDQINEARQLVIKLTNDHKERVGKITKKCTNKRTFVTK